MAASNENSEFFSEKPKTNSSFLNRSLTLHTSSSTKTTHLPNFLDRNGSVKKLHNTSLESMGNSIKGKVKKLCSFFESSTSKPKSDTSISHTDSSSSKSSSLLESKTSIRLPGTEERVVIYFTSLRGIRRTWEDCWAVRMIIKGFRVMVDERDISMDMEYKKELQNLLGLKTVITLPQVFVKGKYIGGVDVIKQLHEVGELAKMLKGIPLRTPGYVCDTCGDVRFIPCSVCNGSRKIFDEDEDQLKRCLDCNENGLIRCPICCSS
ncbi:uncharacterized protein At5g39865-like [Impatiens glandulifera]|uniref:uncharacterized protein At5g39865-like n=1 Tax=Impatiens glandulifera TaxID=253017 RepID=UPI001FB11CFD|nr:uncharacterized protein At5g39865-like [Impatiens glandulifera]